MGSPGEKRMIRIGELYLCLDGEVLSVCSDPSTGSTTTVDRTAELPSDDECQEALPTPVDEDALAKARAVDPTGPQISAGTRGSYWEILASAQGVNIGWSVIAFGSQGNGAVDRNNVLYPSGQEHFMFHAQGSSWPTLFFYKNVGYAPNGVPNNIPDAPPNVTWKSFPYEVFNATKETFLASWVTLGVNDRFYKVDLYNSAGGLVGTVAYAWRKEGSGAGELEWFGIVSGPGNQLAFAPNGHYRFLDAPSAVSALASQGVQVYRTS